MNTIHMSYSLLPFKYMEHNISNMNNIAKEHKERLANEPDYEGTVFFKVKEEQIDKCMQLHDLYVEFFDLGEEFKLESLLSGINNGK